MYESTKAVNNLNLNRITGTPDFRSALVLAMVLLALWAGPARSQGDVLEEILVTAERREVSLQDTAISITAFTGIQLAQAGVETSEQLTGFTPGLNIQRDVIGKVIMRGIGTENFTVAGDPGVALSIDGAYLSRSSVAIFDLYDLDRVEVLRGPQGTLYGRNATGGAINFITRKPTEEFDGYLSADYGNYEKIRVEGAVGGPVSENVSVRLSGLSHNRDGFTDNVFPGIGGGLDELDDKDLWSIRGQLEFRPSETFTILVSVDNYEDDGIASPYKYVADPLIYFGGAPFPNPLGGDLFTVSQGYELDTPGFPDWRAPSAGHASQTGVNGTITWDIIPGLTLKSISAWRDMDFEWLNDGDGIEAYLVNYWQDDESELFTQELQLIADNGGKLNWIIGGYFLTEESDSRIGIPLPLGAGLPLAVLIEGSSETDAYAVFGEASYNVFDRMKATAGVRYSYEEKSADYVDDRTSLGAPAPGMIDDSDSWSAFTPKFGLDYFVNDDLMLYGTVTWGFKSGGFNMLAIQPSYDEEEVISYEVGFKSRFNQDRTQLNASAFYYDYEDLQVGKVVELNATIENAAQATIYGAEIEMDTLLTDQFRVSAGVSILETEYDSFITEDKDLPGAPSVSLKGNELPRAPGFTSSVSAQYILPMDGLGELEAWFNWQHTDSQYFTPFNRSSFEQDSYNLINVRLSYRPTENWELSVYGNNLDNQEYFTNALESGVPTPGVDRVVPQFFAGAPRTYGVRVRYHFN